MSEPNAIPLIEAWLYYQLSRDAELAAIVEDRIYRDVADEDTTYPYVIYSYHDGDYKDGVGDVRVMTVVWYTVKLITKGEPTAEQLVALTRFDEVIGHQSDALLNNYRFSGRARKPISYQERRQGGAERYYHRGGIFKLWCYPQVS